MLHAELLQLQMTLSIANDQGSHHFLTYLQHAKTWLFFTT